MKINLDLDIELPATPNFIRFKGVESSISIADFTDEQLKIVGERWTKKLIIEAQQRRINKVQE